MKNYFQKNKYLYPVLSLLLFIAYLGAFFCDISMQTPITSNTNEIKAYITFYDGDVHHANANYALSKAINKKFDILVSYKKQHIDPSFFKANHHILKQPRGSGYWLWKPYFILKTLESLPDGSIVMYNDAGLSFTGDIDNYIKQMNAAKKDLVFFKEGHINKPYIKKETYKLMSVDEKLSNEIQIDASSLIVRKSEQSIKYIKKWLDLCTDERLLTDKNFSNIPEDNDFKDHRHDQAILTLLYYTEPHDVLILQKNKQDGFFHHRRRNIKGFSLEILHMRKKLTITLNAFITSVKSKFISTLLSK